VPPTPRQAGRATAPTTKSTPAAPGCPASRLPGFPASRLPGFDDANHTRATHAAAAAATRAERALDILGDQVPDNLTAVAALRITHREVSLEALGQMMDPPVTKDAAAGRIRRLLALADRHARHTGIPDTTTALTPNTLTRP